MAWVCGERAAAADQQGISLLAARALVAATSPLQQQAATDSASLPRLALLRLPTAPHNNNANTNDRSPEPLLVGLAWLDPDGATNPQLALRHEAQQGDRLGRYGWLAHDGRRYGRQEFVDGDYELSVTMVRRRRMQRGKERG